MVTEILRHIFALFCLNIQCSIYLYTDRRFLAKTAGLRSRLLNEIERRSTPRFEDQTLNCVVKYVRLRLDGHVGCGHVTMVFR